jgi:hypothetical protein
LPNHRPAEDCAVQHFWFFLLLLATSLAFALLEVQIEGPVGWGAGLPAWRVDHPLARALMGGRTLTGYHLYTHVFVLSIVHLPYALGTAVPSWHLEARIVAFLILFWVFEDFLWFVVNPAFGLRRFRREHAPWHAPAWWWIMPRDYWVSIPVAVVLYAWSW